MKSGYDMIRNIIVSTFRRLFADRSISFINIGGLALGLTSFTLIAIFIENELSYDQFHARHQDIRRIVKDFVVADGAKIPDAMTPPALAPALINEVPEVETATRFTPNRGRLFLMEHGDKRFYESRVYSGDKEFFKVFDFQFIRGDRESAIAEPSSMVITESTARKYFGENNPVGKIIRANLNNGIDFKVTAVIKDIPPNSHFSFDILIPIITQRNIDTEWNFYGFYTYALLKPGVDASTFDSKVKALYVSHVSDPINVFYSQALEDVHLKSHLKWELSANGNLLYVRALVLVAVFVVLIAGFNYVNLTVAQSVRRAREVGVKKVTGAKRSWLVGQFLIESLIAVSLAAVLSLALTNALLPFGERVVGYNFEWLWTNARYVDIILPVLTLLVALLAGIYPALHLSSFQAASVLKGRFVTSTEGIRLRQGLVVLQFVISTALIIALLVVDRQVKYMSDKQLGFDQRNLLLLPNVRGGIGQVFGTAEAMINEIRQIPSVVNFARADGLFGVNNSINGISTPAGANRTSVNFIRVDYEFLPTMALSIREGRNFSQQFPSDSTGIILNETAVQQLALTPPYLGQKLLWDERNGGTRELQLVGIVKDFHFNSFHEPIKPFGFLLEVGNGSTFMVKLEDPNQTNTIARVGEIWKKYYPDHPFEYTFQEAYTNALHAGESGFRKLFTCFTALAIVIACMGLYGLMAFVAQARAKEIGIRKVLGASVSSIIVLVSRDLLILVSVAIAIAIPVSSFGVNTWLSNFAYHIDSTWDLFAIAALATIAITVLTIVFRAVSAAQSNPVTSLKNE